MSISGRLVLTNRRADLGLTREREKERARILEKSASFLFEVFCSQQRNEETNTAFYAFLACVVNKGTRAHTQRELI